MTALARTVYGLLLLVAPNSLLHRVSGDRASKRERRLTRVLGARLLTQAAVTDIRPDAVSVALGAEVDLVHAISMIVWSVVDRSSRRLTLISAALAGLFAAAGTAQARRTPAVASPSESSQLLNLLVRFRHQAAVAVSQYTLPRALRDGLGT
ncbi:hypothetical protein A5658_16485 [Mycobacterium sp. 1245111.1]|uniref:hypothetical protein n=1 Tax=Mycobacterium sp. 1245111.1 TaxID=1834073 RepID=UPI0007FBDAA4|nr:hypothetical protein [Mycobacterium sp. 1245111.1]OBK32305.1 hypothetical protein A5658_16485 [Mycobacterium sp. 1245111.1]